MNPWMLWKRCLRKKREKNFKNSFPRTSGLIETSKDERKKERKKESLARYSYTIISFPLFSLHFALKYATRAYKNNKSWSCYEVPRRGISFPSESSTFRFALFIIIRRSNALGANTRMKKMALSSGARYLISHRFATRSLFNVSNPARISSASIKFPFAKATLIQPPFYRGIDEIFIKFGFFHNIQGFIARQ